LSVCAMSMRNDLSRCDAAGAFDVGVDEGSASEQLRFYRIEEIQ